MHRDDEGHDEDHHGGLARDLVTMAALDRRQLLGWAAGVSALALLGCGEETEGQGGVDAPAGNTGGDGGSTPGACDEIPEETAGPYPGDGSNGANALALSGIVRSDIRSSLGSLSGTAAGVPLTVNLTLVSSDAACAPLVGYAVYLWHCDRDAQYSMYTLTSQNYLRGVQATDAGGSVSFTTIFPACYAGRWPHIHFEIYPTLASATGSGNKIATSQLALPEAVCDAVYATTGYGQSVTNLAQISLSSDNVFSDDQAAQQMATVTGSVAAGYVASLTVPIAI